MHELDSLHKSAKRLYDQGGAPLIAIHKVVLRALSLLAEGATSRFLATCDGKPYSVFEAGDTTSRPYLAALFKGSRDEFSTAWNELMAAANPEQHKFDMDADKINAVLYTALGAFSFCYDLWKPLSRKTPGTFFEILLGAVLQRVLPGHRRTGHVQLPFQEENVATDIVFHKPGTNTGGLVIPVKITTRERIVQPYAHQRILDSVFGEDSFKSTLICMSEMQRDQKNNANSICVPGTIRLFQMHLSKLSGIYYLDPPARYLAQDVLDVIPVRSVGTLLSRDLPNLVA